MDEINVCCCGFLLPITGITFMKASNGHLVNSVRLTSIRRLLHVRADGSVSSLFNRRVAFRSRTSMHTRGCPSPSLARGRSLCLFVFFEIRFDRYTRAQRERRAMDVPFCRTDILSRVDYLCVGRTHFGWAASRRDYLFMGVINIRAM